jgi:probable rRNA maturation factor
MSRVSVTVVSRPPCAAARGLGAWLARAAPRGAAGRVTIALVSDRQMAQLNGRFRRKHVATDVLSFPSGDNINSSNELGDLAIARGVARRQARAFGHPLQVELRILALHGLLHLLGYDHERDHGEMRAVEERLRRHSGLPAGLVARTSPSHTRR